MTTQKHSASPTSQTAQASAPSGGGEGKGGGHMGHLKEDEMERTNEELLAEFEELAEQHPNFMSVAECREVADKLVLLRQEILKRMSPNADKMAALSPNMDWQSIDTAPRDRDIALRGVVISSEAAKRNGSPDLECFGLGRYLWDDEDGAPLFTGFLGSRPTHWKEIDAAAKRFVGFAKNLADHPTGGAGCNPENFVRDAKRLFENPSD